MATEKEELGALMAADKAPQRFMVTLDNSPDEVVKWDSEGHMVFFEDSVGRFLELDDAHLKALSMAAQMRYLVSYRANAKLKEQEQHPENIRTPGIEVSPRLASATARITVTGKDPSKAYCWKRTDELQQSRYEGWKVSQDPNLRTFGGEVGSTHQIAADGKTEMVLMEIPKETSDAMQRAAAEKSKGRAEGVERSTMEDMKRAGGLPYVPTSADKQNFS